MKKIILFALAAVLAVLGLTGCGASDSDCQGDPGKITAKEYDPAYTTGSGTHKVRHSAEYELTIQKADGFTYEKDVSDTAYDDWYRTGGRFPHPDKCKDGKAV